MIIITENLEKTGNILLVKFLYIENFGLKFVTILIDFLKKFAYISILNI